MEASSMEGINHEEVINYVKGSREVKEEDGEESLGFGSGKTVVLMTFQRNAV